MSLSDFWDDLKIAHTLMGDLPVLEQCVDYGMKAVDDGKATLRDVANLLTGVKKIMDDAQGKKDADASLPGATTPSAGATLTLPVSSLPAVPSAPGVTADDLNKQELADLMKSVPWDFPGKPQ